MRTTISILFLILAMLPAATAEDRGVIVNAEGFTGLRSTPKADAAVVAKVRSGESFAFETGEDPEWSRVTLASGEAGWVLTSLLRFHYTLDEIPPADEENSEVGDYAARRGFDYCVTARGAAQGEPGAMKRYFGITDTDGAAAEGHAYYSHIVIHLLGDEKLAAFLEGEPLEYQLGMRNHFAGGFTGWSFEESSYAERHFPLTSGVLCRKEITDWPSPDGDYAIRKTFTEAGVTRDSKVEKAELVGKATGRIITDLTGDDLGTGAHREGKVLWSPDSRCFAYFSGAPASEARTVVWRKEGGVFVRTTLPAVEFPGLADDAELVGAKLFWQRVEPERWLEPGVVELLHHRYFENRQADGTIDSLGRTYLVTWHVTSGEATAKVKIWE